VVDGLLEEGIWPGRKRVDNEIRKLGFSLHTGKFYDLYRKSLIDLVSRQGFLSQSKEASTRRVSGNGRKPLCATQKKDVDGVNNARYIINNN
jgi:hypothetical protein